jgi:hypothetical protein
MQISFIFVNTGCQGRISHGGVFRHTSVYRKLINRLHIPQDVMSRKKQTMPFHCIAVPYPGYQIKGSMERIFNYRMSTAHVVVENVLHSFFCF